MQRRTDAQDVDLIVVPPESRGDDLGDRGHPRGMSRRVWVASFDRLVAISMSAMAWDFQAPRPFPSDEGRTRLA